MSWADQHQIETPEQVDLDLDIAGPGSRFVAEFVDSCLKLLLILGPVVILTCLGLSVVPGKPILLALFILYAFAIVYGYDVYYEGYRDGQTPGKTYAGIRVVSDNGGPADVRQALIRNLVGFADFLPFFYLLGCCVMLLNKRARRLGDFAAGTLVIHVRKGALVDQVETKILATAGAEFVFLPEQLARCNAQDLHILYSFFTRINDLNREERFRLGLRLLDALRERIGYDPSRTIAEDGNTEAFLAALYRDLKAFRKHS